ncbi:hypothetical protein [Kineococcus rhizosphaerae]|uniref:Uncharacterized protein n=1 Tax=Kineococcus rhizosphaerae TaxID=559628 RepID=A0A2T0R872_9ACTN|nr:hypothetical protein [Kineococcus rhizosphaerae]PRY17352.1 hypothetical protein CLV37_102313 [Kineococcus rhizosphaerae]
MLECHPDDLWNGHDWATWWAWLQPAQRRQLLDLAWGEEPAQVLGDRVTRLRGATYPVTDQAVSAIGRHWTRTRNLATDAFLVFLDEQRAAAADHL